MRKWRENFLILPLYPPSLSISYIKICHILSQNVKYGIFVANVTKTEHTRYEEIILGRILCEEDLQVVSACSQPPLLFSLVTQHQQRGSWTLGPLKCCLVGVQLECTCKWSCV